MSQLIQNQIIQQLIPSTVLIVLLLLMAYVLFSAQKSREDFDIANMLKDENGKESGLRLALLVSLAISSWAVVTMVLNNTLSTNVWVGYLATWSGSLVFIKAADKWNGNLPFSSKGE
jgi:hypothetical protein